MPLDHAFKESASVAAGEDVLAGAFGMRHQSGYILFLVADAGDVQQGAVGIGFRFHLTLFIAVAPQDLSWIYTQAWSSEGRRRCSSW